MPDHHHHKAHDHPDDASLAELLDLEGDVFRAYWTRVMTWVRDALGGREPELIVDLGAGTGTGTVALARQFESAEIVALDASEQMLQRTQARALKLGVDDRVRTVHSDLDGGWPNLAGVDLTWASMSLHHVADPGRVLRDIRTATRPGGLVAVAELGEAERFLPDDLGFGRPCLEARCLAAMSHETAEALPALGSQWSPRIEAAGFTLVSEQTFALEVSVPYPPSARHLAQLWLQRVRSSIADHLAQDDLDALAILLDTDGPEAVQRRDDLQIRGTRIVTIARR
ncbi:MAG TPA: class I SAM-dependent methyltransferase [Jatrophihabitantaceae bacterium]|nr:class I SAM-dependent methyltransferase [Jatrophihabitantaceae bacterium]